MCVQNLQVFARREVEDGCRELGPLSQSVAINWFTGVTILVKNATRATRGTTLDSSSRWHTIRGGALSQVIFAPGCARLATMLFANRIAEGN